MDREASAAAPGTNPCRRQAVAMAEEMSSWFPSSDLDSPAHLRRIEETEIDGLTLIEILDEYAEASPYATMSICGDLDDPLSSEDLFWLGVVVDDVQPGRMGYRFTTAGWFGAEELISALMPSLGWHLLWRISVRGAYYFSDPIGAES